MLRTGEDYKADHVVGTDYMEVADLAVPGLIKVHGLWDRARRERMGPPRAEFRLEQFPADVLPCTAVVDFVGEPIDYLYRFFGTRMVLVAGRELTGKRQFADGITGYGVVNAEVFPMMIEKRAPICSKTHWVSVTGLEMTTTTLRLPLSEDGERITGGVIANRFDFGHL